jgi:lysylphosphatidylglycerol synthetase-like protein (DUF2156 family)
MVKKIKSWLNILLLTLILIVPGLVFATTATLKDSPTGRLEDAATTYGPFTTTADSNTLASTLGIIINVALSILGVIFIVIIILAGYQWMMAQGNEQAVTKAKDSMTRAVIGLIIVISSYAIWTFIKTYFIKQI